MTSTTVKVAERKPISRVPATAWRRNFFAGFWRLADPKISLASMSSLFLGACAAAAEGPLAWRWLGLTVLSIFCIEVAKNASGDLIDFDRGVDQRVAPQDRSPFSGGKRVLVDGLLSRRQTAGIAAVFYAFGIAGGLAIAAWREPDVLWLGVLGVGCAFFYHAPPLQLSYRGWGEAAVAVCYGPLIAAGVFLVLRGTITPPIVFASLPLGLLIAAFLWINQFPDFQADRAAGKRNLVVRLGRRRAVRGYAALLALAGVLLVLAHLAGTPSGIWWGALALAPLAPALHRLWRSAETTPRLIPAQALTLLGFVLYSLGAGLGWLF